MVKFNCLHHGHVHFVFRQNDLPYMLNAYKAQIE